MFARVTGSLLLSLLVSPALADSLNADQARQFVAGKLFAFNCFDGTRGAGRIYSDGSAAGAIQFGGSGPTRHVRLPTNTLQVRGENVCARIKGMPFEPCFNLDKTSEHSFRGSVSGMGFAYCEFTRKPSARAAMVSANARKRAPRMETASAESKPSSAPLELRKSAD